MANSKEKGHLAALVTILIWGTTFISTKVLLVDFQPIEISFTNPSRGGQGWELF